MEMISIDVKVKKSKLLQKYTYIKTTLYIIEKTKLKQSLRPKQRKLSWALGLLGAIPFILLTWVKIWIIIKRTKQDKNLYVRVWTTL